MYKTKAAVICLLLYFLYSIFKTYQAHEAPVAKRGSSRRAQSWLPNDATLRLWLFVSHSAEPPVVLPRDGGPSRIAPPQMRGSHALAGSLDIPTGSMSHPPGPLGRFQWLPSRIRPRLRPAEIDTTMQIPEEYRTNSSLYLHVVATPPESEELSLPPVVSRLTKFLVDQHATRPVRMLLDQPRRPPPTPLDAALKPLARIPRVVTVGTVDEHRPLDIKAASAAGLRDLITARKTLRFAPPKGDSLSAADLVYVLPLHVNSMVSPRDEYQALPRNGTATTETPLEMKITFKSPSFRYWRTLQEMDMSLTVLEKQYGFGAYDVDSLRMMTGSVGLAVLLFTYLISILHLALELLALSSDIAFWRKQEEKQLSSLSANTYIMEGIFTLIIFFYLYDTRESKFVLWFCGARLLMDAWKLWKLNRARKSRRAAATDAPEASDAFEEIEEFERRGLKFLALVLLPVVAAVCAYQLVRVPQRGWRSWLVNSLAVCAYTGGFITMTPQLFRNYRLKSVDHMPWATLSYQAVNTFIDDVFSMIIRMPQMHRMSVFRDDIVFVVYMYQRWLYRKGKAAAVEAKKKEE